jgi:predicted RNA methylase
LRTGTREKLAAVRSHYQMFGLWDTFKEGAVSLLTRRGEDKFDQKYGTDTSRVLSMRCDEQPQPGQIVRSLPTHPNVMRYILGSLEIDYQDFLFIDFGCGKGRALLCASDFPFKKIIGVEWSKDLSAIAKRNIEVYRSPRQKCTTIEVCCMSVLDYEFPALNTLLYMYSPFGVKITMQVLEKVRQSVLSSPRRFFVVYSGLGTLENTGIMECFGQFGIEVLRTCRALNPRGSWVLGEVCSSPAGSAGSSSVTLSLIPPRP